MCDPYYGTPFYCSWGLPSCYSCTTCGPTVGCFPFCGVPSRPCGPRFSCKPRCVPCGPCGPLKPCRPYPYGAWMYGYFN